MTDGLRDLMEVRVAAAFIARGLSPVRVRQAIALAQDQDRPLFTTWFRTDDRSVFLQLHAADGTPQMTDLFRKQPVFQQIVERSVRGVDLAGVPARWRPLGKTGGVEVDPERSFGTRLESDRSWHEPAKA